MEKSEKKVLVTGGSGFIGQHLMKRLDKSNIKGCIYDTEEIVQGYGKYIAGNVFDLDKLKDVVKHNDVIVHLVGLGDAGICQKDPMKSFQLNILSLQNLLEVCRFGNKKIIFPSSAAVYGLTDDLPTREKCPPNPTNIYSWHKFICEKLIKSYHDNFGLDYVILRIFNVYGEGSKGVIKFFIEKAKKNETIELFGPHQFRDFVYAGDVAEALFQSIIHEKANNKTINIGSGNAIQIKELVELICNEIFPGTKWTYRKSEFVMYDSIADITLSKILLNFKPHNSKTFMKKILKRM
jgi:UDP-glucose 4-epimerase